jgi:hypothetical protein
MNSIEKTVINLGGREFTITCLPFAKNRLVIPAADFAWKAYKRSQTENEPMSVTAIDNTYLAVFEAVSFVDNAITRDIFNTWNLDLQEMLIALASVCLQTGVLSKAEKKEGSDTPGEA